MKSKFLSRTLEALCDVSQTTFLPSLAPPSLTLSLHHSPNTSHASFMSLALTAPTFPPLTHPFPTSHHLSHRSSPGCSSYFSLWNLFWSFQLKSVSPSSEQMSKNELMQKWQHILRAHCMTLNCCGPVSPRERGHCLTLFSYHGWESDRFKVSFLRYSVTVTLRRLFKQCEPQSYGLWNGTHKGALPLWLIWA